MDGLSKKRRCSSPLSAPTAAATLDDSREKGHVATRGTRDLLSHPHTQYCTLMPCSATPGRVLDDHSRVTIVTAVLASTVVLAGVPDLSIKSSLSPMTAIEARLVSPCASDVVLSGLPALVLADRPLEFVLAAVGYGVGTGSAAESLARWISARALISLDISGKSHDVRVSLRPSGSGWVARALIRPASWAGAATVTFVSLTLAQQRLPSRRLPASLRVGYNHAPADEGHVLWAAEADDVPALQAALDGGASTEEADDVWTSRICAAYPAIPPPPCTLPATAATPHRPLLGRL